MLFRSLGLTGYAVAEAPAVKTHDLDIPRIGYIHSWTRTQDEGWVRAALDNYGVPYQYFGENAVAKMGDLRSKFDVIIYPHGGSGVGNTGGGRGGRGGGAGAQTANLPVPYKSTKEFPALGYPDSTDDVRGALGEEGMKSLYAFVQQGGTLITEGGTSQILPEMKLTPGVTVEPAGALFARGTILRGEITDPKSPLVYGYDKPDVPVYFSVGPVLNAGAGAQPLLTAKRWGRVGDSPLIGAGTYADDRSAAVSATGSGEYFIRAVAAHQLAERLRIGGEPLQQALDAVLADVESLGGKGGLIAVAADGEAAWGFTTPAMYRGMADATGRTVKIYADEEER